MNQPATKHCAYPVGPVTTTGARADSDTQCPTTGLLVSGIVLSEDWKTRIR